jgi:hypothetical protein
MNNKFFCLPVTLILFVNSSSFSQTNIEGSKYGLSKNIVSYKETMISPMQTLITVQEETKTELILANNITGGIDNQFKSPTITENDVVLASNGIIWVINKTAMAAYKFGTSQKINSYVVPQKVNFTGGGGVW